MYALCFPHTIVAVFCCTVCFVALALSLCVAEVNVIPARPRACGVYRMLVALASTVAVCLWSVILECTVCFVALAVCVAGVNVIPARRRDAIRARIVLCV